MSTVDRYDDWHEGMTRAEEASGETSLERPWYQTVNRLLPPLGETRLLEIGCGRGDFSIWLADKNDAADVLGLDFSAAAIATAQARAEARESRARFVVGDGQALDLPDASVDWVISCECLEHVPQPAKMAAEIARVLRPGGGFILTTENYFNGMLIAWLRTWLLHKPFDSGAGVQPQENFFLFWRVRKMFERAGLSVTHMESNHFQWLLLPRVDPAKLATEDFRSPALKRLFRPFGRHFTFMGQKPSGQ